MNLSRLRLSRMFLVARTRSGVPILVHCSVPAIALILLVNGSRHLLIMSAGVIAYLAILLIHELGHQRVAEWRGCKVIAIHIYPIHGSCTYNVPDSWWDDGLIAWGGAAAQLIVAAPLFVFAKVVGSTGVASLDVAIVVLAVYSPIIAVVNLLPISTLDGRKAWAIVPLAWKKFRRRRNLVAMTPMEAMEEALRKARGAKRQ